MPVRRRVAPASKPSGTCTMSCRRRTTRTSSGVKRRPYLPYLAQLIACSDQQRLSGRLRNAFRHGVDSGCSSTCLGSDCRGRTTTRRSRCLDRTSSLTAGLGRRRFDPQLPVDKRRQGSEQVASVLRGQVRPKERRWWRHGCCSCVQVRPAWSSSPPGCQVSGPARPRRLPPLGQARAGPERTSEPPAHRRGVRVPRGRGRSRPRVGEASRPRDARPARTAGRPGCARSGRRQAGSRAAGGPAG